MWHGFCAIAADRSFFIMVMLLHCDGSLICYTTRERSPRRRCRYLSCPGLSDVRRRSSATYSKSAPWPEHRSATTCHSSAIFSSTVSASGKWHFHGYVPLMSSGLYSAKHRDCTGSALPWGGDVGSGSCRSGRGQLVDDRDSACHLGRSRPSVIGKYRSRHAD